MSESSLFGNRIPPSCKYCEFAVPSGRDGFLICHKKGVVMEDFSCRHYRYDPNSRTPHPPLELEKFEEDEFVL